MRATLMLVLLVLMVFSPAEARHQTGAAAAADGQRGPLPVRVLFFSQQPGAPLDSAAVDESVRQAMLAEQLQPDVVVARFRNYYMRVRHVQVEVTAYAGGDVRFRHAVVDANGVEMPTCGGETQWEAPERLGSTLALSHRVRDVLACVKWEYGIG